MQSAQNIPIPRRQHAARRQLHPCADLAPESYGNVDPSCGLGICDTFPGEEDFFGFFGLDDLVAKETAPVRTNFVPTWLSSQPPALASIFHEQNYAFSHQSPFQNALQSPGEISIDQLYPIHEDFRDRYPSNGSVFSALSYSSMTDQSSPRTFQSGDHSWTSCNTGSFTQNTFRTELDPSFCWSFPGDFSTSESPDEHVEIFGASHWPGLPDMAESHLFDISSYTNQTLVPLKAKQPTDHVLENHSCDLDAEWGSVIESLDLQDFITSSKYAEWQDSTDELSGYGDTALSNIRQQSFWHPTIDFRAGLSQTWDFLEEEETISTSRQQSSDMPPMPSIVKPHSKSPEDCGKYHSKNEPNCQEGIWDCFILEDGLGNMTSLPLPQIRGQKRERGPLPPEKRKRAADKRRQGTTCLRCRVAKVECDGRDPCQRCIKLGNNSPQSTPCLKASFLEILKSGSCNYISQRNINHFTPDESRRVKMVLPESFDLPQLLHMLESRRDRFNIRARQASGSLYILDLNECYTFLNDLQHNCSSKSPTSLRTFIDHTLVNTNSWLRCVTDCDPKNNTTHLLSQWNNMPSRATYSIIPHENCSEERDLDPEDEDDKHDIIIAAQISRIVCRKLELDGYASLQAEINKMHTSSSSYSSRKATTAKLGKILLTLRWRMSWWQLLGDGSNSNDIFRDRFVYRVEQLCRVLYFYYFTLKNRIGSWVGREMDALRGEWSSYPDSSSVFDDFPTVNSIQGFEEWLERGKSLIREANVEKKFKR